MEVIVGVDGGGVKTEAAVASIEGEIVGVGVGGPSNINIVGRNGAASSLKNAINLAFRNTDVRGKALVGVLGIAGTERKYCAEIIRGIVEEIGFTERVIVVSDALIALAAATRLKPGVIVIAGTGAIALGVNAEGKIERAGGWGYLLDDEGSGYWIGLKALRAVMKAYDGRGRKTALTNTILEFFNAKNPKELVDIAYGRKLSVPEVASIAQAVTKTAKMGDPVAREILREAGEKLAEMASAVIRKLNLARSERVPVYCFGGVFNAGEDVLAPLRVELRRHYENVEVKRPILKPVVGALILAFKKLGIEVTGEVWNNLLESARKWRLTYEF